VWALADVLDGEPRVSKKAFIVGLAGPSGTGKSTIAEYVASHLNGRTVSMERYSLSANGLPLEERARLNYDEPDVIDVQLLEKDILKYISGRDIESPIYDFANHLRVLELREHIAAGSLLIVEGILALHFVELRSHYDLSIYLEAPDEICFRRRQVRDITERQRSAELVRWQYENTVVPATRLYVEPSKRFADLVIDTSRDLAIVEKCVEEAIEGRRAHAATM
jgi:uridine kinase